jgi:hypothetical protein
MRIGVRSRSALDAAMYGRVRRRGGSDRCSAAADPNSQTRRQAQLIEHARDRQLPREVRPGRLFGFPSLTALQAARL